MRNLPINLTNIELQPWHSLGNVEHICELKKSCMVLYGIFIELLRQIYSTTEGRLLGTPPVLWKADGDQIWIDSELRWEDQHPEVRPAIYVQLTPLQAAPYLPTQESSFSPTDRQGVRHYEQKVTGRVNFIHVASTTGEACALADNTDYFLTMMQAPICEDFCFTSFITSGRTALEKLPKEASEKYASIVSYNFEFAEAWDVKEESPILKSIDFVNSDRHSTVDRANIFIEKKISGNPDN